jgi:hypothetical protein
MNARFDAEYRSFVLEIGKQPLLCRNHLEELLARPGADPAVLLDQLRGNEGKSARL